MSSTYDCPSFSSVYTKTLLRYSRQTISQIICAFVRFGVECSHRFLTVHWLFDRLHYDLEGRNCVALLAYPFHLENHWCAVGTQKLFLTPLYGVTSWMIICGSLSLESVTHNGRIVV